MKREIKEMEEQFVVMCGDLKKSEAQIEQLGEEYSKIGEGNNYVSICNTVQLVAFVQGSQYRKPKNPVFSPSTAKIIILLCSFSTGGNVN